jgi:hypothetical protein
MTLQELIQLTKNKLNYLHNRREYYFNTGDAVEVDKIDSLISITEQTLAQLNSISN